MGTAAEFWNTPCPERGPTLRHVHMAGCEEHQMYQCCHCGALTPGIVRHMGNQARPMTAEELDARLRGQPAPPEPVVEEIREPNDPGYVEPAMALGYPVGPAWGQGRSWWGDGRLNPRDIVRLQHVLWKEAQRGYR